MKFPDVTIGWEPWMNVHGINEKPGSSAYVLMDRNSGLIHAAARTPLHYHAMLIELKDMDNSSVSDDYIFAEISNAEIEE